MRKLLNRIIAVVLVMILLFGAAPVSGNETISEWLSLRANAAYGDCGANGSNVSWSLNTGTGALTITGTGAMKNYTHLSPNSAPWSSYRTSVKTVKIYSGVTSIGNYAFYGCTGLTSITIPNSVTKIGSNAFDECTGLASITIPDSVTSIDYSAFYGCSGLTCTEYSGTVEQWCGISFGSQYANPISYSKNLHINDTLITALDIPNDVISIGNFAFYNCQSIEQVRLSGVTEIGGFAFYGCTNLAVPTLGESVQRIGSSAFYNTAYYNNASNWVNDVLYINSYLIQALSSLSDSYSIADGTRVIGSNAFRGCTELTSITIPNSVTSIGSSVFSGCTGLTSVVFNAVNCTEMGSSMNPVFSDCFALQTFTIGSGAQTIPSCMLYGCSSVTEITIPDSVTSIRDSAFSGCKGLTSIMIPDSVTSIGNYAFSGCTGLTSITIPEGVTSIGNSAFRNCTALVNITLPFVGLSPEATNADSLFGAIFGYYTYDSSGTIRQYYSSSSSAYYFIPSSLRKVTLTNCTSIPYGAFDNCAMLTEITIPNSVTSIGNNAFRGCTGLTTVHFDAVNCTSTSALFSGCTALQTVTIGDTVTAIPASAFSGCSGITVITIPDSVTSIGNSAFNGCSGLTRTEYTGTVAQWCGISFANASANPITYSKNLYINDMLVTAPNIPDSVTSISNYAFYNCHSLEQVTLSEVTEIGNSAFYGCTNLAAATLGESVQTIGNNAFSGCTVLANITIPDSVTSIGASAFSGCTNLAATTLGESIQTIGNNAFSGCTNLAATTLGENVQTIGNGAFYNCSSLATITVPDSVVSIGNSAFQSCTSLTSATLGTGIQTIGTNAFDGCTALESFVLNAEACGTMGTSSRPVFTNCPSLKSVTIGDAATMIPDYAFYNCTSLERVTVGENVRSIGTQAFYNCSALRRIQFRGGKVDIAYDAFDYCGDYALCCSENSYWQAYAIRKGIQYVLVDETSETEFTIENGVLLAYDGTAAKITLPSCVTLVDYEAFRENEVITRVAMSESVTQISNYAFADCRNLTEVFIPDTVTSIGTNAFSGSHPTIICIENSYAHRFATAHNMTVKFVRILIDLENAVMRVEIPYEGEPEVSLVHLTGVSLQVVGLGSLPAKTTYRVGDALDTSGLSLEAHYTNGMTSVLRDGFSVSQPIFSEPGEQTVTLDYCGQTVEFTVTVTNEVVSGDADRSGTLDLKDIALMTRSLAGGWDVDLSDVDVDVNKDGEVNLKDAVLLRRYLAGGWGVQLA